MESGGGLKKTVPETSQRKFVNVEILYTANVEIDLRKKNHSSQQ